MIFSTDFLMIRQNDQACGGNGEGVTVENIQLCKSKQLQQRQQQAWYSIVLASTKKPKWSVGI